MVPMADQVSSDVKLQIGHVLFIDIVGYSKLLITDQSERLQKLKEIVWGTEQFRQAQAEGKLLRLPTGDGGALVFRNNVEAPVLCAMEISKELKRHPEVQVRMGIHSGPVNEITDLNAQANIAGAGINIAQRIMDCGDAGHILLSRHVAEDLEQYPRWRPYLHDLGECEVKHGVRVGVVNLSGDGVGNAAAPKKFETIKKHRAHVRWTAVAVALLVLAAVAGGTFFFSRYPTHSALAVVQKSVAVLPFENLSRDPDNAFFTDGVQDEILTDLAKIADLKVISRTSVMQYKSGVAHNLRKIGEELGVAHVVEGSVQRAANKIRVNAQLIDARNDAHLWAQTYDRDLADVFAIQSEIAKAIADQLQAKLSPSEKKAIEQPPTSDVTAFDLYSRAKTLLLRATFSGTGKADLLQAIDLLNQAVALDPSFFDAYCQLASAHGLLYLLGFDHTRARLASSEAAVEAASRLRPNAGETHLARARSLYQGHLDYNGALAELELARQTLPNDARIYELTGYIQRRQQGRNEDAKLNRAAVDFDWKANTRPLHEALDSIRATNPAALKSIAETWLLCALAERDAAAAKNALVAVGEQSINLGNENVVFSRPFVEGAIARMAQDEAGARAAFTAARAEQEKIIQAQPNYGPVLCVLGLIDAGLGRKEEAIREGRRATELLPVEKDSKEGADMIKYLAMTAAWVGDKDLSCEQLAVAVRPPSGLSYGELKLLPLWDPLRGDPRFEQIVASLAPKDTK
jgi:TolB-like protein/class 3 adenylate cyclase